MKNNDVNLSLDEAIQHCYESAKKLRDIDPCDTCAFEHEQLAHWFEELKALRVECDGLRSNWYKCADNAKRLRAERDAAISDLHKLVPAWKWDGADKHQPQEGTSQNGCVDFG